jgi:hypothetical protein
MTPYDLGWPSWPFTRLTQQEMAQLLKEMERKRLEQAEEALV